ncbi:MAG: NAD-dependent epimerase/dehydratase family protein [Acidithiobacillus sp.]
MSAEPRYSALVTGATGFIGGHLVQRLLKEGWKLRLLVRNSAALPASLAAQVELHPGDLRDRESLQAVAAGVDVVFHCAANVHTWDRRENYEATNVAGLANLLAAIREQGNLPRVVHLSSVDVYGFPKKPCTEDCPTPITGFGYGDSKIAGEGIIRDAIAGWGLPAVILRPSNVMGVGSPFIDRIGAELRNGLMLRIQGGEIDCGFLPIDDLLAVMLWSARAVQAVGETFNVNGGLGISWRGFLTDLRRGIRGKGIVLDLPFPVADLAARAIAAPYKVLGLAREPLLHPLLVRIFGRTCGHEIDKLRRFGAPAPGQEYERVMAAAIAAFLAKE